MKAALILTQPNGKSAFKNFDDFELSLDDILDAIRSAFTDLPLGTFEHIEIVVGGHVEYESCSDQNGLSCTSNQE